MKSMIVAETEKGQRLDNFVAKKLNLTRNKCHFLINRGVILVNDQKVKKSYCLKINDIIVWEQSQIMMKITPHNLEPLNLNLKIIYEDDYLVIIDKPHNLIVHPCLSYQGVTMINGLLYQIKGFSNLQGTRPGIIHRLDKDTTGLIIIGKTDDIVVRMQQLLKERKIHRIYWSLIHGYLGQHGTIDLPLGRDVKNRLKQAVNTNGKKAITHFHTLQKFSHISLLELQLETGRTHQIRAHLAYLNHPIINDPLYNTANKDKNTLQFLHAKKISFIHPITQKELKLEIPLSPHFQNFLDTLKQTN